MFILSSSRPSFLLNTASFSAGAALAIAASVSLAWVSTYGL